MNELLEKLKFIEEEHKKIMIKLSEQKTTSNPEKIKEYGKKASELEEGIKLASMYREVLFSLEDVKQMMDTEQDDEMKEFLKEELYKNNKNRSALEKKVKVFLAPKDPNDAKNVIVEIRGGAGGDEAALFAGVLHRLYTRYAENRKWKHAILSSSRLGIGGFKEIMFEITGESVYGTMKYESGVHRVQRVPTTESQGRIHTSTATVAVLPEVEDIDVEIDFNDLRIDVFRSSGPGGQSVNTTDSAVRVTHLPTGMVVSCQDEKSQLQNKDKALKILRARLKEEEESKQKDQQTEDRRMQIGTGDRSERIRTYNYPKGRVTDHRINLTIYRLEEILKGDLDELIGALKSADEERKLEKLGV